MAHPKGYHRLEGSERRPAPGAKRLGPAAADEKLTVILRLRRPPGAPPLPDHEHWAATPPGRRRFLSHEEYARMHGAAKGDVHAVARFARRHGLRVVDTQAAGRTVSIAGTVAQISRAFGVELGRYEVRGETYRGRDGFVYVPPEMAEIVVAVFGLDDRRVGYRNGSPDPPITGPLAPTDVAQIYNFPAGDAAGQIVGVVEFGGGYQQSDLKLFAASLGASFTAPTPVDVPSGSNPGPSAFGSDEVTGDICVASAVAQKAAVHVYYGTDSTSASNWFTTLNRVAHPQPGDPAPPTVVSISWALIGADDKITGGGTVSTALVDQISGVFQEMAALGMTVFVASGDGGSNGFNNPAEADGKAHVAYPASDPWVTCCGGTTLGFAAPPSTATEEWVWNEPGASNQEATGGGVSAFFAVPSWQQGVVIPASISFPGQGGRGVPDVAGNASLVASYPLWVDAPGASPNSAFSGTSAVAPLYAGLAALLNKQLGQSIGFLNPTLYAFADSVCRDINAQLFVTSPQNNSLGAAPNAPGYPSGPGWDACTGLGVVDGGALLAALTGVFHKDMVWVIDRSSIGESEVAVQSPTVAAPAVIPNAFYVVVDGFRPADLGITPAALTGPPGVAPAFTATIGGTPVAGMSVVATALLAEDNTTDSGGNLLPTPQRFTWVCEASFASTDGFTASPLPVAVTLQAALPAVSLSATASVELIAQSDPYELDGATSWLSTDLRVFQMETGNTLPGLDPSTKLGDTNSVSDPTGFIQGVITAFNQNPAAPPGHPFDLISTDEQTSEVTLDANGANGKPVYNFAVARVRYQSAVSSGLVRGFFRLYQAATTSTAYDPDTYGSFSSGGPNGFKIPLFGVDGAGNVVSIPCFANQRVDPGTSLSSQTDKPNLVTAGIPADPSGGVTYTYFGCWLDINQQPWQQVAVPKTPPALPPNSAGAFSAAQLQTVMAAVKDVHQCVVFEISYDDDSAQVGQTPASSDKLAQRNLVIVQSDNPGEPASHRIPHTFDIRPTPLGLSASATPDELMIEWGNTPAGSTALLYLPGVDAAQVIQLAERMYPRHLLEWVDDHTLRCRVAGATWVPVPRGAANLAGLFTLDLPPTVRKGQAFTVVTRQITSATSATGIGATGAAGRRGANAPQPAPPAGSAGGLVPAPTTVLAPPTARVVLGAFQLTIPVATKDVILQPEERRLAALRYIYANLVPGDRWQPVLQRYLDQITARVIAFGGNPQHLLPLPGSPQQPHGGPHGHPHGHPPHLGYGPGGHAGEHHYTGKVGALIYDHFGDFTGFLLDTEDGERTFDSRERAVEAVVRHAWGERLRTTVWADRHDRRRPLSIVLRHP
jgi:hypothetical protein